MYTLQYVKYKLHNLSFNFFFFYLLERLEKFRGEYSNLIAKLATLSLLL